MNWKLNIFLHHRLQSWKFRKMKLSQSLLRKSKEYSEKNCNWYETNNLVLAGVQAAAVEKCPAIETVDGQVAGDDGIECNDTMCRRVCQPGYTAVAPRKAECTKVAAGQFEWSKEIGGCVTCNIPSFNASIDSNCKVNSSKWSTIAFFNVFLRKISQGKFPVFCQKFVPTPNMANR